MQAKHEGILRAINNEDSSYNILTFPTHEAYQSNWANMPHTFFLYQAQGIKPWNNKYRELPKNHILLDGSAHQIHGDMSFDMVLSQNKFGQFQVAKRFADMCCIPLISIEHTLPVPEWSEDVRKQMTEMRGDANVFISDYSISQWGFDKDDESVRVIHHGINTDLFKPKSTDRKGCLSVVNDWINRDWCCGWELFNDVVGHCRLASTEFKIVGDTKGLSEPAKSTEDLVSEYQSSSVFVNTSLISPVPTAMLEAMACGCAVVTTNTCMIPEIVEHGVNGFMFEPTTSGAVMAGQIIEDLIFNPDKAREIGANARKTIEAKLSLNQHNTSWMNLFTEIHGKAHL